MGFPPDPLHPAVIHFPIALAAVAFLVELIARHRQARHLESAAALLIVLAALGGVAATVTGNLAEEEAVIPAVAGPLLEEHEELGERAMWLLLATAAARLVLAWRKAFRGWLPWAYLVLAAAAAGAVGYNGHLGGQLVFRHGVGTAPVQRGEPASVAPAAGAPD
ncbi:MAG: DUF2231 domain-containing protein [Acidobacteriota bacterium]